MWYASPVLFAKTACATSPTAQQRQILEAIANPGAKVAIASGHGTGKSTALAIIALWFLVTRHDAKIPCTAPTGHQLEDVLWGEIRAAVSRMPEWLRNQIHVSKNRVTIDGSAGFIVARTARPESPEALQGFHGEHLLFIIDEGAGVDDKIFEVAYGALSTPNARAIMPGNPTLLTGFFYRTFHSDNSWVKFQFSSADSELADEAFIENAKRDYGEDSDMFRVRVLGQFPRAGLTGIVPAEAVDAALSRRLSPTAARDMLFHSILGVDPAWEGEDRSVVVLRQGPYARVVFCGRHLSGDVLAQHVMRLAAEHRVKYIFVDKTGVGASCCDFLTVLHVPHVRVSFAESPNGDMFMNRRAEIWWKMREWFVEKEPILAPFEGIRDDIIAPTYGIRDNGKIYLESKEEMRKKGIKSPDLGDALALTFCIPDEMMTAIRVEKKESGWSKHWDERQRRRALGGVAV